MDARVYKVFIMLLADLWDLSRTYVWARAKHGGACTMCNIHGSGVESLINCRVICPHINMCAPRVLEICLRNCMEGFACM